jgi:hypothetical protein
MHNRIPTFFSLANMAQYSRIDDILCNEAGLAHNAAAPEYQTLTDGSHSDHRPLLARITTPAPGIHPLPTLVAPERHKDQSTHTSFKLPITRDNMTKLKNRLPAAILQYTAELRQLLDDLKTRAEPKFIAAMQAICELNRKHDDGSLGQHHLDECSALQELKAVRSSSEDMEKAYGIIEKIYEQVKETAERTWPCKKTQRGNAYHYPKRTATKRHTKLKNKIKLFKVVRQLTAEHGYFNDPASVGASPDLRPSLIEAVSNLLTSSLHYLPGTSTAMATCWRPWLQTGLPGTQRVLQISWS